jgi:hypothetical protein
MTFIIPIYPKLGGFVWFCQTYKRVGQNWRVLRVICTMNFRDIFWNLKGEKDFRFKSFDKIVESSLSNVWQRKDLAKLAEKNEKVKTFFFENFKS